MFKIIETIKKAEKKEDQIQAIFEYLGFNNLKAPLEEGVYLINFLMQIRANPAQFLTSEYAIARKLAKDLMEIES